MRELRRIADKMRLQEHMKKLVRYFYVDYLFVQQEAHITFMYSLVPRHPLTNVKKGLAHLEWFLELWKYETECWVHDFDKMASL